MPRRRLTMQVAPTPPLANGHQRSPLRWSCWCNSQWQRQLGKARTEMTTMHRLPRSTAAAAAAPVGPLAQHSAKVLSPLLSVQRQQRQRPQGPQREERPSSSRPCRRHAPCGRQQQHSRTLLMQRRRPSPSAAADVEVAEALASGLAGVRASCRRAQSRFHQSADYRGAPSLGLRGDRWKEKVRGKSERR